VAVHVLRSIGSNGLKPGFRGITLERPLFFYARSRPQIRHLALKKLRQIAVKVTRLTVSRAKMASDRSNHRGL
jgi:hypothetical protein|tara:strand:- start:238 stop:456 length:219 start_codon:yes stop_codon:yes gene_type:complete